MGAQPAGFLGLTGGGSASLLQHVPARHTCPARPEHGEAGTLHSSRCHGLRAAWAGGRQGLQAQEAGVGVGRGRRVQRGVYKEGGLWEM